MKPKSQSRMPRGLVLRLLAATTLACIAGFSLIGLVQAQSAAPSSEDAKAIVMRMADYISKLPQFSVNVSDSYDTYQKTGQMIEFGEMRKMTVVRPDRMRVEVEESNGQKHVLTFDGKDITLSTPTANVFAQTPKPGNLDDAIVYFVRDLGMKLPFAVLLITQAPAELAQRTTTIDYVEKTSLYGVPAHVIAGRTKSVDYQVWIADGDKPLPLRLVLTYVKEKGEPQFRAQFSDWNLVPQVTDATFAFVAPQGAQKIAFLAQLPRSAAPGGAKATKATKAGNTTNTGERK